MRRGFSGLMTALFLVMAATFVWAEPVVKEFYYSKLTTLLGTFTLKFSLWDNDIDGIYCGKKRRHKAYSRR
jgi:hypothetical protein